MGKWTNDQVGRLFSSHPPGIFRFNRATVVLLLHFIGWKLSMTNSLMNCTSESESAIVFPTMFYAMICLSREAMIYFYWRQWPWP